uniref:ATP synthase subunit b n=1 Tax=Setaria digitata TaxID=48799 RepID=A0A915PR39_9BILA
MALNRYAVIVGSRAQTCILWCNQPIYSAFSASVLMSTAKVVDDVVVKKDAPERIGFFTKLKCRFQGIPLKGELHAPISFMRDIGKQYIPPPLPEVPKDFKEYPERDLVNYPYPVKRMYPPKLRLMIVPDKFMNAFHKYTGTSGPYVFFAMLYAFFHTKGLFEIAHDRVKILVLLFYYYIFSRAFNYRWDKYFYEKCKETEKKYLDIIDNNFKAVREVQETSTAERSAYAAVKEHYPIIFKESLSLQLEATYRKNVERLATEMKRRLDYLQETETVKRNFARDHMLKWIIDSVHSEIMANKENIKEKYMDFCIEQLKGLSLER